VLAGGLSRRMGGHDKGHVRIGATTILERVIVCLSVQCDRLLLNVNGDPARYADTKLKVVADSVPGYAGPLAGILAGLDWAAANAPSLEWMVSAPNDCPFLPNDLVTHLHAARADDAGTSIACANSGGRQHPVVALWPVRLRTDLRHALLTGHARKVETWAARYGVADATWPCTPIDPFFNVNTPEDVAKANRIAAQFQL
jgi:molybdenum cofactor guanylyltransferase